MISRVNSAAALAAGLLVLSATPAAAAAGNAAAGLQAMRELNVIVFDNMAASDDIEGKAFIGGNYSGQGIIAIGNASQGSAASTRRSLTVGGHQTAGALSINNGSNGGTGLVATHPGILVGGSSGGFNFNSGGGIDVGGDLAGMNLNLQPGQVVNVGGNASGINGSNGATVNAGGTISGNQNGATFAGGQGIGWNAATTSQAIATERAVLMSDLGTLSATLAGLTVANASTITGTGGGGVILTAVDGGAGFALFNIDSSFFTTYTDLLTYDFGTLPVIINVAGTAPITWNLNAAGGNRAYNQSVIWNFHEATSIQFNRMVNGSVLAPLATIANNTPIEGSVVAKAFNQGGEVHLGTYAGNDAFLAPAPGVPEPAAWMLLITGFGLVGMAARRRTATITA